MARSSEACKSRIFDEYPYNPEALKGFMVDSCPFGVGGYLIGSGLAWWICIPEDALFYGVDAANNVLAFLGMCVSMLLLVQETLVQCALQFFSQPICCM